MSAPTTPKSNRRRKIAIFLVIVIGFVVYLWFFGPQTATAIMIRWSLRNMPFEKEVPTPLAFTPPSKAPGLRQQYFGYEFEVPWSDLDSEAIKTNKTGVLLPFRSGVLLRFYSMSNHELIDGLVESTGAKREAVRKVWGDNDYDLLTRVLYTTPRDVTPFISEKAAVSGMMSLVIKGMCVPETSGMYQVAAGGFRGFQYGNLSKHPWKVVVDLYTADRGVEFVFLRKDHHPLNASQAEINRVIQTLSYSSPQTTGL